MKRTILGLSLTLVVSLSLTLSIEISSAFGGRESSASGRSKVAREGCVTCEVRSDCWACVAGGQADLCPNVSCEQCTVRGLCDGELQNAKPQILRGRSKIKLSPDTIRQIANVHPRFAATLAKLNKTGIEREVYQMKWTPVPLAAEDIEWYLQDEQANSKFFTKRFRKARQINALIQTGEVTPIVYKVWVEEGDEAANSLVRLQSLNGSPIDPSYSSLEVRLANSDIHQTSKVSKTEWRIY